MLQRAFLSDIINMGSSWLLMPSALSNEASVRIISCADGRWSGRNCSPLYLVLCRIYSCFLRDLNSDSDVGLFPRTINCTGAHTTGLKLTPIYWSRVVWNDNYACVVPDLRRWILYVGDDRS